MIALIFNKLKGWLAAAGVVLVALLYAYARGRRGGITAAHTEAQKKATKTQEKWTEIDNRTPDLDGALDSLRKRSRKG